MCPAVPCHVSKHHYSIPSATWPQLCGPWASGPCLRHRVRGTGPRARRVPVPRGVDASPTQAPRPAATVCVVSAQAPSPRSNSKSVQPFSLFGALLGSGASAALPPPARQVPRGPQSRPRAKVQGQDLSHLHRSRQALLSIPSPGVFPFPRGDPAHAGAPAEQQEGVEGLGR